MKPACTIFCAPVTCAAVPAKDKLAPIRGPFHFCHAGASNLHLISLSPFQSPTLPPTLWNVSLTDSEYLPFALGAAGGGGWGDRWCGCSERANWQKSAHKVFSLSLMEVPWELTQILESFTNNTVPEIYYSKRLNTTVLFV